MWSSLAFAPAYHTSWTNCTCTAIPFLSPATQQTLPKSLGPKARKQLECLLDWLMPPCLRFVRKTVKEISPTSDAALACAAMRIVGALLGARPSGGGSGGAAGSSDAAASGRADGGGIGGTGGDVEEAPDQDGAAPSGGPSGAVAAVLAGADDAAKARLAEAALLLGLVWGVGASADAEGREAFDRFFR